MVLGLYILKATDFIEIGKQTNEKPMRRVRKISYRDGRAIYQKWDFTPMCEECGSEVHFVAKGKNPSYWYTRCGICGVRERWSKRHYRLR